MFMLVYVRRVIVHHMMNVIERLKQTIVHGKTGVIVDLHDPRRFADHFLSGLPRKTGLK